MSDKRAVINKPIVTGLSKNTDRLPDDSVIACLNDSSIKLPRIKAKINGAAGKDSTLIKYPRIPKNTRI